jgi:predicted N-formylglutamate amidohydrolase
VTLSPTPSEGPWRSIEGVAQVETMGDPGPPDLLVEVPHGADERSHFDALAGRMTGALPADLFKFFHANTDIGAWAYGRAVAERVMAARPSRRVLLVRCLIPRTLIDANREVAAPDALATGGLTGAVPPYVEDERDLRLLHGLHARYVELIDAAYDAACHTGMALSPHTYGPYVLPIAKIDHRIVESLIAAHAPDVLPTLGVRAEVDLLTDTAEGEQLSDPGLTDAVEAGLSAAGLAVVRNGSYRLLPGSQTYRQSARHRGRVLCLEVRRDRLVERYTALEPMNVDPTSVARVAEPLAAAIDGWLGARGR